ncbi:serine/threonine protein kinase [Saprolegnia diclina VS20]|uniref:Serine/threonine protein kinase n=1 Tax=Saprolegnia diclina (strain VS20) TaxID=1156394 RepID=T0PZ16_SAPDV|nr:serine/threonine protein kinase [Saprolegnia diclina VS20]EQC26335.1 serine/threonine protein kinase [Saprolegnia diclina VS20]|eukprot:XP_008620228.1 serine/threonine protein kinase [Saprolegnia diclina VS20]
MTEGSTTTDESLSVDVKSVLAATALALIILYVACCLRRARHEQLLQGPASDAEQDVAVSSTQSPPAQVSAPTAADMLTSMTELQSLRIPTQSIRHRKFLARGAHCSVYSAQYDGAPVAIKVLSPDESSLQQKTRALLHELLLCYRLEHPNVMRVLGVAWTEHHVKAPSDVAMVMELLPGGNLQHLLAADIELHAWKWLSTKKAPVTKLSFAIGIMDALEYMHAQGVLHGGLKAKNVFLTPTYSVKLSDLGVTRHTEVQLALRPPSNAPTNRTAGWIAPELFQSSTRHMQTAVLDARGSRWPR